MKKLEKRQIVLLGVLVVVLAYYLIDRGVFSTEAIVEGVQKLAAVPEKNPVEDIIEEDQDYTQLAAVEIVWDGEWKEDPFYYAPPDSLQEDSKGLLNQLFGSDNPASASGFEISGISWHGNTGYAIINGEPITEGQSIGGYTVEKIAFNYAILVQGKKTIRLTLNN
ncbi:MAG: hypothetical protein ACE5D2_06455 [Fidelibacterota bacterium]